MSFGGVIHFTNEKYFAGYAIAIKALTEYGFKISIAVKSDISQKVSTLLSTNNINTFTYINSINELAHNLVVNGFFILLTVEENTAYTFPGILHSNISVDIKTITTEPGLPTSYSFNISKNVKDWEQFINFLIRKGSPSVADIFNKENIVFKGSNINYGRIALRRIVNGNTFNVSYRIKPNWNFSHDSSQLIQDFGRLFSKHELVNDNIDYFMIINMYFGQFAPEKTIYFMMEPYGEKQYQTWLDNFKDRFLFYGCHKHHLNFIEPHVDLKQAIPSQRKKGLSIIVSSKTSDPGQRYRIDIAKKLDDLACNDKLGFELKIWGQCKDLGFKNYYGELPRYKKDIALDEFTYHFTTENNRIDNYITEKLYDGFLRECYTFYLGAPNAKRYFSKDSFHELEGDIDKDITTIVETIANDPWNNKLQFIRESSNRILSGIYNADNRISSIVEISNINVGLHTKVNIEPKNEINDKKLICLKNQSFKDISAIQFELSDTQWLLKVAYQFLMQRKNALIIFDDQADIHDLLYQNLSEAISSCDDNTDMIHLTSKNANDINEGYLYMRLHCMEKLLMHANSGLMHKIKLDIRHFTLV